MIFVCNSILVVLITIEAIVLSIFCVIVLFLRVESFIELLLFLTVVVGERILGLVLILLKVGLSGEDFFRLSYVV